MTKLFTTTTALALSALTSSIAHAEPLDTKIVPATAKWVMHVDVDALTDSAAWKTIEPKLREDAEYARGIEEVERIFQVNLDQDLHSVTLYGSSFRKEDAVVVVHARADRERLAMLLSFNEGYAKDQAGSYIVHTWAEADRQNYGAFASNDRFVVAPSSAKVAAAMDVLEGKKEIETINSDTLTPPLGTGTAGVILYVAGEGIADLATENTARSPLFQQVKSASVAITGAGDGLKASGKLEAVDADVARNVVSLAEGARALVNLNAADDNLALLGRVTAAAKVTAEGSTVTLDWPLSSQTIGEILDHAIAAKMASQSGATTGEAKK
jgi:hypothetical protein